MLIFKERSENLNIEKISVEKLKEGLFEWDKDLEENPPAILYSYLRPIITTTSIDANLPPLVIP